MKRAIVVAAAVALLAGCGGDDSDATPTETDTVTTPVVMTDVRAYFLRDGKVWPVARRVGSTELFPLLSELHAGPTTRERVDLGLTSALSSACSPSPLNSGCAQIDVPLQTDGVAKYDSATSFSQEALAQIVYTLTQIPAVNSVEYKGKRFTRADFEEQTPSVLVESPLGFEEVESPIRVEGTANTFEANFHYELTDTDGLIVDENFVTATSGTGTRGTFEFTTDEYTVPFDGIGALIVFERSAEDGSKMNIVEIPLRMSR